MSLTLSDHAAACRDLLCSEDASELADDDAPSGGSGAAAAAAAPVELLIEFPDDSDESIAQFIEGAADYSPGRDYADRFRSNSLDSAARQGAVAWILKVHAYYRFRPLTAYLAVNYMDRFLSCHTLPQNEWALPLLSVSCLSLAAKMEETLFPSLLDLQVEGARFVFEPCTVLRMEFLVLNALNWRLRSVTPFTFIDFFVHKIDPVGKHTQHLISWVVKITLATTKDVRFLNHCPASLAAAAIICATDEIKDLDYINPAIAASWCIGLTEERITNCYQSMQRVIVNSMKKGTSIMDIRPWVSSSSSPPNKRRKLNYNCLWVDND